MTLTTRQKYFLLLLAFAIALLSWQVYETFLGVTFVPQPVSQAAPPQVRAAIPQRVQRVVQVKPAKTRALNRQLLKVATPTPSPRQTQPVDQLRPETQALLRAHPRRPVTPSNPKAMAYTLVRTGQHAGQWFATIKHNNRLYDVVVGSRLPDQVSVIAISKNLMILQHGKEKRLISQLDSRVVTASDAHNTARNEPMITRLNQKKRQVKKAKRTPVTMVKKAKPRFNAVERALLKGKPSDYTIQLMANTDRHALEKFAKQHGLTKTAKIYRTTLHGMPWYVLVYQQFDDSQAALAAIAQLPLGLQRYSPFVKRYQHIQAELRRKGRRV